MDSSKSSESTSFSYYRPLDVSRNEIRVISFLNDAAALEDIPPEHHGLVRCRLETVSLDDRTPQYSLFKTAPRPNSRRKISESWQTFVNDGQRQRVVAGTAAEDPVLPRRRWYAPYHRFTWGDYGALSYTWGDQTDKVAIWLNGAITKVGRNLEKALRALAASPDYSSGLRLWVDAICINQLDIADRNSQVKRMGTIFGDALIVTIWLGNVLEEQRPGLELISDYILRSTNDKSATGALEDLFREDDDRQARTKLAVEAIDVLVQAPYWSRVWVIQEKCLGPFNPDILFGPLRFPLLSLHNFLEQAHRSHSLRLSVPTRASTWRILKLVELMLLIQERRQGSWRSEGKQGTDLSRNESDVEMLTLLLMLGRLGGAVDLRDKLYGLMGMMPEYIARYIEPDYNKPVEQVFSEFAHALIVGLGHFNFSLAGLSNTGLNIPSWVPDLTDTWDPSLWGTDCEASGGRQPLFRVEHHGLHLVAAGFQVDVVDGTAPHLGWGKSGELEVWKPAVQPSSAGANTMPDDFKTAIVRTLHRDTSWDCDTGTTVLDIPWLESSPEVSTSRTEAMRQRGWGPVLQHAKYADLVKLYKRLDENFRPWGRRFRSFFNNVDVDDNDTLPQCRQPDAFVQSLDKHVGVVYPIITTEAGRFGTAIRPVLPGDAIFVILGCDGLVVLRPAEEVGAYQVISQCYVEGLMKGEAMGRLARGEFTLGDVSLV